MRKSIYTGKQNLYSLLHIGGAKAFISGNIYKDERPSGSKLEDIVINGISVDNEFLQDGVYNVNCYVPLKEIKSNGVTQFVKDNTRLSEIFDHIHPMLFDQYRDTFNCTVEKHEDFTEESERATYINFRVNVKFYNI